MHEQYGLKRSLSLRLCKALSFLLFLTFILSFFLMFFDTDLITGMSDERKQNLLSNKSFQTAVRLAHEISKKTSNYDKVENINAITVCTPFKGLSDTKVYLCVTRKNGDSLYFTFLRGFEETDADTYAMKKLSYKTSTFKDAEINFLNELLNQENINDLLYQFKKDEVTSKRYWNILLKIPHISKATQNYRNISSVRIGSPHKDSSKIENTVIEINFDDGNSLYYMFIGIHIAETDYNTYCSLNINEEYFDKYELEVLFKEAGFVWQ